MLALASLVVSFLALLVVAYAVWQSRHSSVLAREQLKSIEQEKNEREQPYLSLHLAGQPQYFFSIKNLGSSSAYDLRLHLAEGSREYVEDTSSKCPLELRANQEVRFSAVQTLGAGDYLEGCITYKDSAREDHTMDFQEYWN